MLATALSVLLAAPGVSPEALDAIMRAQAAQAARSHKARFEILYRSSGRRASSRLEIVPPDRAHHFDDVPSIEQIQIGDRGWIRSRGGDWEADRDSALTTLTGPEPADDWGWALRSARQIEARDLGGVRCRGYEYALESGYVTRLWVAEATGLPARYEQDIDGDTLFSWALEYDPSLVVAPPPGQPEPRSRPARPPNATRITLPVAWGSSLPGSGGPVVVVRSTGDLFLGADRVADAAALARALRTASAVPRILADGNLAWSAVEVALDAARESGEPGVELGVRRETGGEAFLSIGLRRQSTPPLRSLLVARPAEGSGAQQVFEVNGTPRERDAFGTLMRDILAARSSKVVDVRVARPQTLQQVVALIDLLERLEADVLVTTRAAEAFAPQLPPPPPPPPPPPSPPTR